MNRRQWLSYAALLAGCFVISVGAAWTTLGRQFDNDVYDFLMRTAPDPASVPSSLIVGIDEQTLRSTPGGIRAIRRILTDLAPVLADSQPRAVAVDILLADTDPADDAALAKALARVPNLVLATDLTPGGEAWEDPVDIFRASAVAVGHVHADPDRYDNVLRQVALEKITQDQLHRRFALSLEAFRVAHKADILEAPESITIAGAELPARREESRPMLIRYRREALPVLAVHELLSQPEAAMERIRGKVVFIGITAQSASQDRHATPVAFGRTMPGVEINASAYETLAGGSFPRPVSNTVEFGLCLLLAAAAGVIFAWFAGWPAYALAAAVLAAVHLAPPVAFRQGFVLPYAPLFSSAWISIVAAASYQYFFVRRMLRKSEAEKDRYQRAIHFVAHEMKTPLSTIQGSSELMGRYKLSEDKRAEMTRNINTESKRLAKMIRTFLDVERLSEGQMELKRAPVDVAGLVNACVERALPLAESKEIRIRSAPLDLPAVAGDQELLEYAVYNLINNAIKYSPGGTEVSIEGASAGGFARIAVRDQGIGMDSKELASIFRKFYRTQRAEASGESGTGIGLSIVEQIVSHHGGRLEVSSEPGKGSCFAMLLPFSG